MIGSSINVAIRQGKPRKTKLSHLRIEEQQLTVFCVPIDTKTLSMTGSENTAVRM
jgi:hypothetical protein